MDLNSSPIGLPPHDAPTICHKVLEEAGVALTPGIDFEDPNSSLGFQRIRFSYSRNTDEVRDGMRMFKKWWINSYGDRQR